MIREPCVEYFTEGALTSFHAIEKVGLVIPTLNAGTGWITCLAAIRDQSLKLHRMMVIDSESTDETVALAVSAGFEIEQIKRSQFNHGGTRQWAAERLKDCGIIIFMTQDAIPVSRDALAEIVECFSDPTVAVAYGRQLPHKDATPIEAHARKFNYGPQSKRKDGRVADLLGAKAYFCSNAFAAYRRSVLINLGGFKRDVILGEDMEFAARAIKSGYANLYCAAAAVYHSHDYTISQTLSRYFDIGVFDDKSPWMCEQFGSHRGEGTRFVASELRYLFRHGPWDIPRALCQTAAKLIGYYLGRLHRLVPTKLKRKVSRMPNYWT